MPMRKYGEGQIVGAEQDGEVQKTAHANWSEEDSEELREENEKADE